MPLLLASLAEQRRSLLATSAAVCLWPLPTHTPCCPPPPLAPPLQDVGNKRPPFRGPFSSMAPDLVRIIRGFITDSVAYLKGLVTAGEVLPAAKQHRDRMLGGVVAPALQRRVDAAAGDDHLSLQTRLQLVASIAALMQALVPLDDFALLQARGEEAELAAQALRAGGSPGHSPGHSPGRPSSPRRPASPQPPPSAATAAAAAAPAAPATGSGEVARGRRGSGEIRQRSPGAESSKGSAPSPPGGSPSASSPSRQQEAPARHEAAPGHSVLSVSASGDASSSSRGPAAPTPAPAPTGAPSPSRGPGGRPATALAAPPPPPGSAAAALQGVLESAEAVAMQAVAAEACPILARGELLDWVPDQQLRNVGGVSPYMEDLIMLLKEASSAMRRQVPAASAERLMAGLLSYVADAVMLQLMSGGWGLGGCMTLTHPPPTTHPPTHSLTESPWVAHGSHMALEPCPQGGSGWGAGSGGAGSFALWHAREATLRRPLPLPAPRSLHPGSPTLVGTHTQFI